MIFNMSNEFTCFKIIIIIYFTDGIKRSRREVPESYGSKCST